MDLKLIKETKTRIGLQIEKEDFSIPDIIHHELLKDSKVIFAGVEQLHPILKRHIIKVGTKKTANPIVTVMAGSKRAVKNAEAIMKETERVFKEERET